MIDWEAQPLGIVSDVELADRLGVTTAAVRLERNARGLACANQTGQDNRPATVRARIVRFMVKQMGATAAAEVLRVKRAALVSWFSGDGQLSRRALEDAEAWSRGDRRCTNPERSIDDLAGTQREPLRSPSGHRTTTKAGQP